MRDTNNQDRELRVQLSKFLSESLDLKGHPERLVGLINGIELCFGLGAVTGIPAVDRFVAGVRA